MSEIRKRIQPRQASWWKSANWDNVIPFARSLRREKPKSPDVWPPFRFPEPPPGVIPGTNEDIKLALDDFNSSFSSTYDWANNAIRSNYAEGLVWLGFAELALLAQRAEYRVLSETIAAEMTREWIEFKSTGDNDKTEKIKELTDACDNYRLKDVITLAIEHDGFFGRGQIYIDTGDTDNRDELKTPIGNGRGLISKQKVQKGKLKAFRNVEPMWVYPTNYNSIDPLSPNWYRPEQWFVMGKEVHRTRLLTLIGRPVPDILKPAYSFAGLSMSQMAKPYVDNWLRTRQSVSDLIHSFSVFVLKTDLQAALMPGSDKFWKRIELFNILRDNSNLFVLNKTSDEDFANVSAPIGGLHELQSQSQEHMCSVGRIPAVKLLNIQPAGFNASSQGELIAFDDWIAGFQERLLRRPATTLIDFVQLSLWGETDPEIMFEFKPLQQVDPAQLVQNNQAKAQTDMQYIEMGAVTAEEVRERLAADEESPYQGLDLSKPIEPPAPPDIFGEPGVASPGAEGQEYQAGAGLESSQSQLPQEGWRNAAE